MLFQCSPQSKPLKKHVSIFLNKCINAQPFCDPQCCFFSPQFWLKLWMSIHVLFSMYFHFFICCIFFFKCTLIEDHLLYFTCCVHIFSMYKGKGNFFHDGWFFTKKMSDCNSFFLSFLFSSLSNSFSIFFSLSATLYLPQIHFIFTFLPLLSSVIRINGPPWSSPSKKSR